MNNLRFSIIFAVIRPEISEQISVGLIIFDKEGIDIRYSQKKLDALNGLLSNNEQKAISKVVISLKRKGSINSAESIDYLTRYSNNLITISPIQYLEVESTELNKRKVFSNYVYDNK